MSATTTYQAQRTASTSIHLEWGSKAYRCVCTKEDAEKTIDRVAAKVVAKVGKQRFADTIACASFVQGLMHFASKTKPEFHSNQVALDFAHFGLIEDETDCLTTCDSRNGLVSAARLEDEKCTVQSYAKENSVGSTSFLHRQVTGRGNNEEGLLFCLLAKQHVTCHICCMVNLMSLALFLSVTCIVYKQRSKTIQKYNWHCFSGIRPFEVR